MYSFTVRKSNDSESLLIEFVKGAGSEDMIEELKSALSSINAKLDKKEDLWMNDEMLYHMNSDVGKFQISADVWDFIFILANDNQPAISKISEVLVCSAKFVEQR